jgi:ERCC4-type nuclease
MDIDKYITLKVDHREGNLKSHLVNTINRSIDTNNLNIEFDNLSSADFIIKYDNNVIVAYERKSINDLLASIKDGRYRIQKEKLIEHFGRDKIMYIIEGGLDFSCNVVQDETNQKSIITSMLNTQLRDNIRIVQTKDINATCSYLVEVLKRVLKEPTLYLKNYVNENVSVSDGGSITSKNDFISKGQISTKEDLFFFQMTQVPGISAKTALAFVNQFKEMKHFYEVLTPLCNEEKLKLLKNITIDEHNKKRRINSKVAEFVVKYMF